LGFGKTEIFLQRGLDSEFIDQLTDLPAGQSAGLSDVARRASKPCWLVWATRATFLFTCAK
jgi:hypothetical protein